MVNVKFGDFLKQELQDPEIRAGFEKQNDKLFGPLRSDKLENRRRPIKRYLRNCPATQTIKLSWH
ncbi:hypothetical protein LAC03_02210 [Levilactobacillus acidifarinae]|nr:hypothetical protein LAC03_02210 [Levilactobacillus acidifarinae]